MKLIDADPLLKAVKENKELYERERLYLEGLLLNAPTVEPEVILARVNGKYASMIASFEEAIANGFTRDELQGWLYEIVMNNMEGSEKDKVFADCVVEIIDRLDGFERYVEEKRREGEA